MSYGYVPPPPPASAFGHYQSGGRSSGKKAVWIIVGVVLAMIALLIVVFMLVVITSLKSNEPYRHAVDVASHDSRVIAAMGTPLKTGWAPTGRIQTTHGRASGYADLAIGLEGSKHRGTIYVLANRSGGIWSYRKLAVTIEDTSERIDLLSSEHGPDIPNLK